MNSLPVLLPDADDHGTQEDGAHHEGCDDDLGIEGHLTVPGRHLACCRRLLREGYPTHTLPDERVERKRKRGIKRNRFNA